MGLFGNLFAGGKLKKASKKAAKVQIKRMEEAKGEQRANLDTTLGYYEPYRAVGEKALGQYGDLLGLGGADVQQTAIDQLRNSPFYQSLYRNGEEAVLQNASATGGVRGGNATRSLYELGEDTLARTIDRQLTGLGGGVNIGQNANAAMAGAGQHSTDAITQLLLGQGEAKAQDIMTRGMISNNFWTGLGSMAIDAASAAAGVPPGTFSNPGAMPGAGGGSNPFGGFNFGSIFGGGLPSSAGNVGSPGVNMGGWDSSGPMSLSGGLGATGSVSYGG